MNSPTIAAPGPIPPDASPLAAPRVPQIEYPPKCMQAPEPVEDCDECSNLGRTVFGMYGGKVAFVNGCQECGREERDC